MCQDFVFWRRVLALSILCLFIQKAMGEPIYPVNNDYRALARGTTARIFADWSVVANSDNLRLQNLPDRSFQSIWVRMFPLLSVPLGDPYPETVFPFELSAINSGGINIYSLADGLLIARGNNFEFDFARETFTMNGQILPLVPLWMAPQTRTTTTLGWDKAQKQPDGKPAEVKVELRGGFVIKKTIHAPRGGGTPVELWSAINVVSVNEYLQAVVPSEVIASWRPETLRTQAIAARTYGLYEVAVSRQNNEDYDVDPSTWYQSYQGALFWNREARTWRQVELPATTAAVNSTGGKVILYGNELIKAYFSSNSGGRTCTAEECLEIPGNPPYLQEVEDAPGIQSSPGGTWGTRATLTADNIKNQLKNYGLDLPGTVQRLEHLERGPSGRTWRLRVVLTNGQNVDLDRLLTRKIMHLFGPIRSFDYELGNVVSGRQQITGHGYGHGVGMSQWGAQLFARSGWDAERILQHFYYNVTIKNLLWTPNSVTVGNEN